MEHTLDKSNSIVGTIFMDLSKAFDTLNHNLLFVKLNAWLFVYCDYIFSKLFFETISKGKCK